MSSRMDDIDAAISNGWRGLNAELVEASVLRVKAGINSTIIDIAFDDIQTWCENQAIDCIIPSDQIKVKLTQDVINRFIELVTDLLENLPPDYLPDDLLQDMVAVTNEQFTLLLNTEVVLGETHYSQLDGAPYDYSVQADLYREPASDELFATLIWPENVEFNARWHNDGNVAKFIIDAQGFLTEEYFYQNNNPSELVIASYLDDRAITPFDQRYVKLVADDPDNAGVLVELARVRQFSANIDGMSFVRFERGLFQGRIDNDGGYATLDGTSFNISDIPKAIAYTGLRDSFNNVGNLIAASACIVSLDLMGVEVCDEEEFVLFSPVGSSIIDSPHYFQPGSFDSLAAVRDAIRWTVEGLPVGITGVAVVSADPAIELSERELLCRGFPFVGDDTRMFCSATDEQLDNTVVLELVDGEPGRIIPTAKLVPIQ
ncbi:MAG: hypothetical protein AB8B64_21695 [Granulosicoccus sp.]